MKNIGIRGMLLLILMLAGCNGNDTDELGDEGQITFEFHHLVDGEEAVFDQLIYENAAGNIYEITNVQWFISDVALVSKDGGDLVIAGDDWIHYVDTDIPDSHTWSIDEGVPAGEYSAIRFTFGIKGENNIPNLFPNPPESNMIWPYHLGGDQGGCHFMKLNGFWKDIDGMRSPFNFHIGVGQEYDDNGDITGFIQNWRTLELPNSSFTLLADESVRMVVDMNIGNWFKNPHTYDHNIYGGKIMNNQEAMEKIKDNCDGVYTISVKKDEGDNSDG